MSVIVNESESNFSIPDEGQYLAVVADVIDLGKVTTRFGVKDKVQIVFLLDSYDAETQDQHRSSLFYNKSLHEKSGLRKAIRDIMGYDVSGQFDMDVMLGQTCLVVIQHNEREGNTYANIVAVLKAPKGQRLEIPADFQRKIDRDGTGTTENPVNVTPAVAAPKTAQTRRPAQQTAPAPAPAPAPRPAVRPAQQRQAPAPAPAAQPAPAQAARPAARPAPRPAPRPVTRPAPVPAPAPDPEPEAEQECVPEAPIGDEDIPF